MDELELRSVRRMHDNPAPQLYRNLMIASGVVDERDLATASTLEGVRDLLDPQSKRNSTIWKIHRGVASYQGRQPDSVPRSQLLMHPKKLLRGMTASTATAGGFLVDLGVREVVGARQPRNVLEPLGAVFLPGQVGDSSIARFTAAPSVTWQTSEATPAAESTPTLGMTPISPRTAIGYVEIPRQAVLQMAPSAEAMLERDMLATASIATEGVALAGSGLSGQPLGILNIDGIGTASGVSLGNSQIVAAQQWIANQNGLVGGSLGAVAHPDVAALLMQRARFSDSDTPLWEGALAQGRLAGMAAFSTNSMPEGTLLIGDFSQLVIPIWGVLTLDVNPFANFQAAIIGLRVMVSVDVAVRWPQSFFAFTDVS